MEESSSTITISIVVRGTVNKVWEFWTLPEHITRWNFASADWHCPHAENDVRVGAKFRSTMASKDGKMSFDFEGVYDRVVDGKHIAYTLSDGRKVTVDFKPDKEHVNITSEFEPETTNPEEMQRAGWQTILDNFKKYVESR